MTGKIKVSVIIPIYNVEKYIEASLESVMKQSLKEIEIICINDGSTDSTLQIIKKFAEKDDRIRIIDKKNEGVSAARNAGLAIAVGEYIHCLDSDDMLAEETYEKLYQIAKQNDLDNIFFDADSLFENEEMERKEQGYRTYYHRNKVYDGVFTGPEIFTTMLENWDFKPSVCLQMIRRDLIVRHNLKFYYGIIHEDNLFSLQTILVVKRSMHINKCYYKRTVHEGSIMTTEKDFKNAWGYYICCKEMYKYITALDLSDSCLDAIRSYIFRMNESAMACLKKMDREYVIKRIKDYPLDDAMMFMVSFYERSQKEKSLNNKIKSLKAEKDFLNQEIYDCRNCNSFRIGRIITYLPRRIKGIIQLLKEKGADYAWYRFSLKFTKRIRVSVIIPVYNVEKYLRECLDSILNQTLNQIEVICVDDGSSDDSLQILHEYSEKDARLKVVTQQNLGAGEARNQGLKIATGEYVIFLDSDDYFDADLCNLAYYKSKKAKADICLFAAERFDMNNNKTERMGWVLRYDELPLKQYFSADEISNRIFQITTGCPWSKMIKREFIIQNGLNFQALKNSNDVLFMRLACALAKKITTINKTLVTYRWNEGNNLQSTKDSAPVEFYKAFRELKNQLKLRGIYEKFEKSYVNMVLTESLHNLKTVTRDESKKEVVNLLIREGFEFYELEKFDKQDFYNQSEYEMYCELLKNKN